jgi:uncharacterized protein DUF4126
VVPGQGYTLAVDALIALGRTIPFAFASGINLYATVAVLGLCSRFHIVALPDQFRAFEHPLIISVALAMYVVEFVADKVPWFDSLWDTIHTVVRPIGGALVAVTALGDASAGAQAVAALIGGSVAMTTHLGKAGTRAVANTSPEPFSNWALSLGEDAIAIGLTYFAIQHPLLALAIAVILLVAIIACATVLIRAARSRFGRRPSQV